MSFGLVGAHVGVMLRNYDREDDCYLKTCVRLVMGMANATKDEVLVSFFALFSSQAVFADEATQHEPIIELPPNSAPQCLKASTSIGLCCISKQSSWSPPHFCKKM